MLRWCWSKWGLGSCGSSKAMDCDPCDGWRRRPMLLWVVTGVLGSILFSFFTERCEVSSGRGFGDKLKLCGNQLPDLESLWSILGKELKVIWPLHNPLIQGEYINGLLKSLLKIIGWTLIGKVVVSVSHPRKPNYPKQKSFHQQKHSESCGGGGRWRKRLLFLGVMVGLLVSFWIFWSMRANIVSRREETLANMCDERARMLQDQFNVSMNHVHALAIMISTFYHGKHPSAMDQTTFAEYTARTSFERPLTYGVAYALKVLHPEREEFEKLHGWVIKKMDNVDHSPVQNEYLPESLDPALIQDEYAPVILSQETVAHIVSVDMMSGKEDRENILRARTSGKGVLTSPFKLLKSNHLGVVLTFAVYKTDLPPNATPEDRIEATEGYLGASFDVETLVEKLLHQLASKQTIVVNVYDTTDVSAPIKMYGPETPDANDTGSVYISSLDFGDPFRKHEMQCRFKQKPSLPWSAITTSLGVAVIVLLIGHIFHAAISRIEKVEDDYHEMRELKVRAEAADVAKSQFLATVSHEIRTPMNGVLGMLQMLMDTSLDATQQDFAMTAQASGKALISLINEVLDQAKIESGRLELEAVSFDIRAVLDNVLSLFSDKSQDKGIELAVYISDRVPEYIVGDPCRFRQIITNLVGNSIKFTEEGHIFVSVTLVEESINKLKSEENHNAQSFKDVHAFCDTLSGFHVVDRSKSWENFKILSAPNEVSDSINLLVVVEDTGVGIPRDAQSRIFMPFMQADSSTSRMYGGTGIGLSISKCLVEKMVGEIGFVSEAGVGSTFAFTAMFKEGQRNSDAKRHQPEIVVSDFQGMGALVVDGSSVQAEVTKYHLRRLGIHVEIAIKPKSLYACIYDVCNSRCVNMVFVDKENWTKTTGNSFSHLLLELWQNARIKSLEKSPKIFILATSLNTLEVEKVKSTGFTDNVIMKPLRLSKIVACLQKALGMTNKRQLGREQPLGLRSLLSGKHILVVDDNIVNRRVAAGALKKYGAVVTCAESGKVAVKLLQPPHKFDACFMDVQMPEMDGFEATRHVRASESKFVEENEADDLSRDSNGNVVHWHVPILAMTADVFQATNDECMKAGMDGYVSKPFEEEQLYSCVAHFLESSSV